MSTVLMNLLFKFKITIPCTFLNQNTTKVALLNTKSKQVKVATKKKLLKMYSLPEKTT